MLLQKRRDLDDALADLADLEARCRADLKILTESTKKGNDSPSTTRG